MLYQESYLALNNDEIFYFPPYKSILTLEKNGMVISMCIKRNSCSYLLLTNATNLQLYIALSLFETAYCNSFLSMK